MRNDSQALGWILLVVAHAVLIWVSARYAVKSRAKSLENSGRVVGGDARVTTALEAAKERFLGEPLRDANGAVVGHMIRGETAEQRHLRLTESEEMARSALADAERLGPEHPQVADCLTFLGHLCTDQKRYSDSLPFFRRALEIRQAKLPPGRFETGDSLANLGECYMRLEKDAEAEPLLQAALRVFERTLPADDGYYLARCRMNLANLFHESGRTAEAQAMGTKALRAIGSDAVWYPGM
jgi:tetratricopeptide (TPR) repeat protein